MRAKGIVLALVVAARAGAAEPPLPRDEGAHVEKVGEGVYAILHVNATDEWPHGNSGVVVGEDGVLVVDSTYLPSRARADIALIKKLTPKPVRWLVNTHWHFDHNNGASAYRDVFPGVAVIAERQTARWIELNATYWSKMSTAPGSSRRAALAKLEAQVTSGQDDSGKPLAPAALKKLSLAVRQRKAELEELATLRVVTPEMTFDGRLTVPLGGGRRVELVNRGPGNSPADVTAYVPDAKVLFTGDILVEDPLPYPFAAWPVTWIAVLRDLEATPITAMVPGHGPVMRDHAYTRRVRELIEAVCAGVERLAREGRTLDQVQKELDLEPQRKGFAPWNEGLEDPGDWKQIMDILIERAWKGVRGQG